MTDMSALPESLGRSTRGAPPQPDFLPGMPDASRHGAGKPASERKPPKAEEYKALTLDEVIERAHALLDEAWQRWPNGRRHTYLLFSGGGDSSILAHLLRDRVAGVIHVRTGISVPATWDYVRDVCAAWNVPVRAAEPVDRYEDLVMGRVRATCGPNKGRQVWIGFPGPAGHGVMYNRLKERALDRVRRQINKAEGRRRGKAGDIIFVAGMRWDESQRRYRNAEEFDQDGSIMWVSPIVWWTDGHMREYRERYMCRDNHEHAPHRLCRPGALPLSEVTEHLHMSGDCLCGAFAKPGELGEIAFFYPDVARRLQALQDEAAAAGLTRCIWGEGRGNRRDSAPAQAQEAAGRLCSSCVPPGNQEDITDLWLEQGLISRAVYDALRGGASAVCDTSPREVTE